MTDSSNESDPWSYTFPPSTESLPQIGMSYPKPEPVAQGSDSEDLAILNEHLRQAETIKNRIKERNSSINASKLDLAANEDNSHSSETFTNPSSLPNPSGTELKRISLKLQKQISNDTHSIYSTSNSVNSVSQSMNSTYSGNSAPLQSPFLGKSIPADPFTTREDASSVMSREGQNGLAHKDLALKENLEAPFLEKKTGSNGTLNLETDRYSHKRSSTEPESAIDGENLSPKIIAYRKSKRTTSEYNFQDILDAARPREKYDTKLYVEEKFRDTEYRYATIKRNTDFHQLFRSLDLTDRFLDDFACALSREILLQGRIYVSEQYICFNSSLLGWVTNLVIKQEDIVRFEKKSTAGIFPNGIAIETKTERHTFASFISRDSTFDFMKTVWEKVTGKKMEEKEESLEPVKDVKDEDSNIESFIMSLDGDEGKLENSSEDSEKHLNLQQEEVATIKVAKFKKESGYRNRDPLIHGPTKILQKDRIGDHETEIYNDAIHAPVGVVFEILFNEDGKFFREFLESHDSSELNDFGGFIDQKRSYSYRKALGYLIGPKSTTCQVEETIVHFDVSDYIIVETITRTPDVPLGNSFCVKNRYRISWGNANTTKLQVTYWIEWSGRSWIKGVIEKLTLTGQTDACEALIQSLKEEIDRCTYVELADVALEPIRTVEEKEEPVIATTEVSKGPEFQLQSISQYLVFLLLGIILVLQLYILRRLAALEKVLSV